MFLDHSSYLLHNPAQLNYGIAVTDVDADGSFELIVAGFGCPNLVLKWIDKGSTTGFINIADPVLADPDRRAIGVAACDFDGDGREEIYILNTDTFGGRKQFGDRLFQWKDGQWIDLFSLPHNQDALNLTAGRSVACIDRTGKGYYGFFVANYGGPMRLYELNEDGMIEDVAPATKLNRITGGRGVVSLPLVSGHMDIFATNENGSNFLFRNLGNGIFEEIAQDWGIDDPLEHGRGIAVLDANSDGILDLAVGNWEGPHRLFVKTQAGLFQDLATPELAHPSRIRTVISADFDNDGYEELFFNNIGQPNRLFGQHQGKWIALDLGDALEPQGLGTGAAIGDFNQDGRLELLIAHGESDPQPLSLFFSPKNDNGWLRVLPLTPHGAPARGSLVTLTTTSSRKQIRAIDAGSGYLCQMEPVAHFGLGTDQQVESVEICWPDGIQIKIEDPQINQLIRVPHPRR